MQDLSRKFSEFLYQYMHKAESKIGFAYSTPLPLNLEGIRGFFFLKYTS